MENNVDKLVSYTSASVLPLKVILSDTLLKAVKHGIIPPLHIQFIPTNKCNLNCAYCSCSERTKNLDMDLDTAKRIIDTCRSLGTKAVTITGGGEPLCYPHFDELVDHFSASGMKIGLVTNGLLLHKVAPDTLRKVTWCRISHGDDREFRSNYAKSLDEVVSDVSGVDWSFSYVVTSEPNMCCIRQLVDFANQHNFTHVRLVSDLLDLEHVIDMSKVRDALDGIDDSIVIYQGRKDYVRGGDCYICYLKPVIGVDHRVYACCGVQYALEVPDRDMPLGFSLGMAENMEEITSGSSQPFDGSRCVRCYYNDYNVLLGAMLKDIKHREFL